MVSIDKVFIHVSQRQLTFLHSLILLFNELNFFRLRRNLLFGVFLLIGVDKFSRFNFEEFP